MSMTDRRIDLDIGLTRGMPDLGQPGAGASRRDASDADRQAFEQALAQDGGEPAAGTAGPSADALTETPRPFALFPGAVTSAETPAAAPAGLARALNEAADRMLVGDGGSGRREVRLDLKAEVLPGVTLSVYEEEGRLVAAFACASEASRETLNRCAQSLAEELAQSLARAVLVRVATDDPEDPCLFEAAAAA
jgi:hypothetical protein